MFMWEGKKHLETMLRRRGPNGGEVESQGMMKPEVIKDEGGEIDHRHVAAQDIMAAIHEKSPEKLMQAMGNFMDIHMGHNGTEPDAE